MGVAPSQGWGVLHLLLRARRGEPGAEGVLEAIGAFTADEPNQVIAFSVLVYSLSSVSEKNE